MRQHSNRAIRQWWAEARIDELDEALLGWMAAVELQPVEPQLGIVEVVERRVCDLLVIVRAA
jgi:hypothetical protein